MFNVRWVEGLRGLACGVVLALTACDVEGDVGPDEALGLDGEFRSGTLANNGWGCRRCDYANSPHFGPYPIDEFFIGPEPRMGLELDSIEDPYGARHDVVIEEGQFQASTSNGPVYGAALAGWILLFVGDGIELPVTIGHVEYHPDWVEEHLVATYSLHYVDPFSGEGPLNVCPGQDLDQTSVLLLDGERYDPQTKTVIPESDSWTTMACRGHALAKMKLMGFSPDDVYGSGWEQRQATLKMITADYCGTGTSFTALGTPLDWIDELAHFEEEDMSGPGNLEAQWNENGATCLNDPRVANPAEVAEECVLPMCPEDDGPGTEIWASFVPS